MKSYYGNALSPDNNKVVHDLDNQDGGITEEIDGITYEISSDADDYNFERYRDYKPEETQVCSNSLSRPAIITLIAILTVMVVSIIVIIIVKVSEDKSKASESKDYVVKQDSGKYSKEEPQYARVEVKTEGDEDFEDELAIEGEGNETEEPTPEPTKKPDNTKKIKEDLEKMASSYPSVRTLIDNMEDYPERLLEDVIRNPEMLDYTLNYPNMVNKTYSESIDITRDVYNSNYDMPLFIQWDSRWGYYPYSSGVIGISGCGPTCLAMVYVHLTGDTTMNPLKMAKFSVSNGYVTIGVGTKWALMTSGANYHGLQAQKISISESEMIYHLQQGHPLIASMGPGIFTDNGHFIVFRKYENGKFYVNDPFCKKHTDTAWSYSEFSSQIKGMWAYWK